jgi:hypothetical protein
MSAIECEDGSCGWVDTGECLVDKRVAYGKDDKEQTG